MRARDFFPMMLSVLVVGGAIGALQARFGVPSWLGTAGIALFGAAAVLYFDRHKPPPHVPSRSGTPYRSPYAVRFDDVEVVVTRAGAPVERVHWDDLVTVGVRIDEGFLPQPWWLLFGRESTSAQYPSEAHGASEMLHELQRRLPGFDNTGVIQAMGMMSGGMVLWERTPSTSPSRQPS